MKRNTLFAALCLVSISVISSSAQGSTISFLGADIDIGASWRDVAVPKAYDGDHNNVYGSAGYYLIATRPNALGGTYGNVDGVNGTDVVSAPSWTNPTSFNTLGVNRAAGFNYANVNDPSVAHNGSLAPTITPGTVTDGTGDKASFTIAATGPVPLIFNVAIMVDNLDGVNFNAASLYIQSQSTAGLASALEPTGNQIPDMYVFQIFGAANNEVFHVGAVSGINNTATFAALAFDTVVPEPSCVILAGIGVVGLLLAARRRRKS